MRCSAQRAGARRFRAQYARERLGLGRWRERGLRVGRGEGRDPETDIVGLSCGGGNGSTNCEHCGRRDRAERRVSARGGMGCRIDGRPRPVGGHLLFAARRRSSLDLVTQERQANRQHLAAQQQRSDESDEREFHASCGIYYDAVGGVMPPQPVGVGIGSSRRNRRRSSRQPSVEESFGTAHTRRSARTRWLASFRSICVCSGGRSGSP